MVPHVGLAPSAAWRALPFHPRRARGGKRVVQDNGFQRVGTVQVQAIMPPLIQGLVNMVIHYLFHCRSVWSIAASFGWVHAWVRNLTGVGATVERAT